MKHTSAFAAVLSALILAGLVVGFANADDKPAVERAHFHHVRLNVTDPEETIKFYKKHLGAVEVAYHNRVAALFTERSFILFNKVDESPPYMPKSAISHIGWASVDGQSDYEWLKSQGVEFETDITQLGNNYYQYFYGPDKELVELWTGGKNHRFDHVHLWATDVAATTNWFRDHLGLTVNAGRKPQSRNKESILSIWIGRVQADNVGIIVFGRPDFDHNAWPGGSYKPEDGPSDEFEPTKGRAIDHIAFSYRDIKPVFERMQAAGVEIVEPISTKEDVGHTSFFVMAPDDILVEVVQAKPIPDSSWE